MSNRLSSTGSWLGWTTLFPYPLADVVARLLFFTPGGRTEDDSTYSSLVGVSWLASEEVYDPSSFSFALFDRDPPPQSVGTY